MEQLLRVDKVFVQYGGVRALDGASVSLDEGEIVALMGPNGAGKSTILKTIFGLAELSSGKVLWHERAIKPVPHEMVAEGIAFVPQGRRVFRHLTVLENLEIGGFVIRNPSTRAKLSTGHSKKLLQAYIEEVLDIFPMLRTRLKAKSGTLSGGQQQMLAIARALIIRPQVLLLDEPSLGLAPKVVKEVFAKIKEINERHRTAILVVEHNLKSLLHIVHRAYVLDKGAVVSEGKPDEIMRSGILEKVFFGKE